MYKITKVGNTRVAVKPIVADGEVKKGDIILTGEREVDGFLAEVVILGKDVDNPEKNDNVIDLKVGDLVLIDRTADRFPSVNGIVVVDSFEIDAVVEKSDSPNTPDEKKIDSTVTVS